MKKLLQLCSFDTINMIKENSQQEGKPIPKREYKRCFQDRFKRWYMCIVSNCEYFERDKMNFNEQMHI